MGVNWNLKKTYGTKLLTKFQLRKSQMKTAAPHKTENNKQQGKQHSTEPGATDYDGLCGSVKPPSPNRRMSICISRSVQSLWGDRQIPVVLGPSYHNWEHANGEFSAQIQLKSYSLSKKKIMNSIQYYWTVCWIKLKYDAGTCALQHCSTCATGYVLLNVRHIK